jgi:hypothetical protein
MYTVKLVRRVIFQWRLHLQRDNKQRRRRDAQHDLLNTFNAIFRRREAGSNATLRTLSTLPRRREAERMQLSQRSAFERFDATFRRDELEGSSASYHAEIVDNTEL